MGNVIFEAAPASGAAMTEKIERVLKKTFGFAIKVVVRDAKNIEKVSKSIPADWVNDGEMKSDVLFLWEEFDSKSSLKLIAAHPEADRLKYASGAIIWSVDRGMYNKSGMRKCIASALYKNITARNVNTVRKLAALLRAKRGTPTAVK